MNNLKKFATEADYSAATLNYPAVSWIVSGDTVHFDKTEPVVLNDKIIAAFSFSNYVGGTMEVDLYNAYGESPSTYFSSITFNDAAVEPISDKIEASIQTNTVYTVKYGITTTTVNDCFVCDIGTAGGSNYPDSFEFLIPSQITSIDGLPSRFTVLVVEATTPPTIDSTYFSGLVAEIYVPDESVNDYKAHSDWASLIGQIHPISEYSGNLPV